MASLKHQKPIKILIPNGTSPRNIGDLAMLTVLIDLIHKSLPLAQIIVHSTDPHLYEKQNTPVKETLYSFTAFENPKFFVRLVRFVRLFTYLFLYEFKLRSYLGVFFSGDYLFRLCQDYQKSDLIIFTGGGYLRSRLGITQSLNLLMQLFMIKFARIFPARIIISPISFGPFAYAWQEKLAAWVLSDVDLVAAREEISYQSMSKYKIPNLILSSDHALLLNPLAINFPKTKTIGFTIRQWLLGRKQLEFEEQISTALLEFSRKYGYRIQPILQVNAKKYGEDDYLATKRVVQVLKKLQIRVKKLIKITDLNTAQKVYSSIDLLLGMRMHSNILAAVSGTPFISIAYEFKSEGISKTLGMEKYCLSVQNVNSSTLFKQMKNLKNQLSEVRKNLVKRITDVRNRETSTWLNILSFRHEF